jgi:hypothetical protein
MTAEQWRTQVAHLHQSLDRIETHVDRRTADLEACMGELTARVDRIDTQMAHRPSTWLAVADIALGGLFVALRPC